MGQAIPNQHPAVVLRSHFQVVRALLAVAMIAVVGLTVAVVVLATEDEPGMSARSAALTHRSAPSTFDPNSIKEVPGVRYDGGPEEGTRGNGH
jgi:hypothetical protein